MTLTGEKASCLERAPAIRITLFHFFHRIHTRLTVFVLDVGRNPPAIVAQFPQNLGNRRIALPERHIGSMILFAVLDMQRNDSFVILADVSYGITARRREVADIKIDRDVFGSPVHGPGKSFGCRELIRI